MRGGRRYRDNSRFVAESAISFDASVGKHCQCGPILPLLQSPGEGSLGLGALGPQKLRILLFPVCSAVMNALFLVLHRRPRGPGLALTPGCVGRPPPSPTSHCPPSLDIHSSFHSTPPTLRSTVPIFCKSAFDCLITHSPPRVPAAQRVIRQLRWERARTKPVPACGQWSVAHTTTTPRRRHPR